MCTKSGFISSPSNTLSVRWRYCIYCFSSLLPQDRCPALLLSPIHLVLFCFEVFWWSRVDDLLTIIHWNKFLDGPLMSLHSTYVKTLYIVKDVSDTWHPEHYYLGASCCSISIILHYWSKKTGEESNFNGCIEATSSTGHKNQLLINEALNSLLFIVYLEEYKHISVVLVPLNTQLCTYLRAAELFVCINDVKT